MTAVGFPDAVGRACTPYRQPTSILDDVADIHTAEEDRQPQRDPTQIHPARQLAVRIVIGHSSRSGSFRSVRCSTHNVITIAAYATAPNE